jgi:hypothetical protein
LRGDLSADGFALTRFDARNWQIINRRHPPADTRHPVAWITETGEGHVRVKWARATPLPSVYQTATDALNALWHGAEQPDGATGPTAIPHFPPPPH